MRLLSPLRSPAVALLWTGLSLSAIGDQLYTVALIWVAVGVLGPAAGYLTALGAATVLTTALLGGRWTDRWAPRRAMLAADLGRAAVLAGLVTAWALAGRPSAIGLVAAVLALAAGQGVFRPALQTVLPELVVDATQLPAANALFDTTERIARLLGPSLIGLLAGVVSAMQFFALDALSFLASAAAIVAVGRLRPMARITRPTGTGLLAAALRGFRAVHDHPLLRWELAVSGLVNGAWFAALFLAVPLSISRHHIAGPGGSGLGAYGLVISSYGLTNLLSTLAIGSRELPARPGRLVFAGNLVMGGGIVLMGLVLAGWLVHALLLPAICTGAALAAPGGPMHDIPIAVARQTELPAAEVAPAVRASLVATNAGTLIGMLAAAALLAWLPDWMVIAGCGTLIALVGIQGFAMRVDLG